MGTNGRRAHPTRRSPDLAWPGEPLLPGARALPGPHRPVPRPRANGGARSARLVVPAPGTDSGPCPAV